MNVSEQLDRCREFADVFELVKRSVERSLGRRRVGLMLYLADLPMNIGAFHTLGTNGIVLNRAVMDIVTKTARTIRQINSYVYSILLHEYLHSLGVVDERQVRELVVKVTRENLGEEHEATQMALRGPLQFFPEIAQRPSAMERGQPEIVVDFEKPTGNYIG